MKRSCLLKLDSNLNRKDFYQDLKSKLDRSSTLAVFVETYEIRISKSDFQPMLIYLNRISFLTILDIHKAYFKGRCACRKWPSSLFSLKKLLHLYANGFVTKELPDLHCWWTEELCSQQPLQVSRSHVLGSVHHWLVTYWDSCIEQKDYHYNTSPIRYWGKGSTIGWYWVLRFLLLVTACELIVDSQE